MNKKITTIFAILVIFAVTWFVGMFFMMNSEESTGNIPIQPNYKNINIGDKTTDNKQSQSSVVMSTYIWRFFQDRVILEDVYKYAKNN